MDNYIYEGDSLLSEDKYKLKKKIFSLPKMEGLVFSDPRLSSIYEDMSEEGREKYGYHYNETIMNILFNDYVLTSPKYLEKYKQTLPAKNPRKKGKERRRDAWGIEKLKSDYEEKIKDIDTMKKPVKDKEKTKKTSSSDVDETTSMGSFVAASRGKKKKTPPTDVDESTSTGSVGDSGMGSGGYETPKAWSSTGKVMMKRSLYPGGTVVQESTEKEPFWKKVESVDNKKQTSNTSKQPFWKGGKVVNNTINEIKKENYLINPKGFKNYIKEEFGMKIEEHHLNTREERVDFIAKNMNNPNIKKSLERISDDEVERIYHQLEKKMGLVKEATNMSMIDDNPTSMSNKGIPTGDTGSNLDKGVGGMNETLLNSVKKQQNKIKNIGEDRKPSSLVLKDRLGDENKKNFKKDMTHSGTSKVVNTLNKLEDIDKRSELKNADKDAFKNVGNSTNEKGDEIPKRNLTDDEFSEVDLMRKGLGDFVFDNKPDERFEKRMEKDMGEKNYKLRKARQEYEKGKPMYNKDTQPVSDGEEKTQYKKERAGWNDRVGTLQETVITGKYVNDLGKNKIIDVYLHNIQEAKTKKDTWKRLMIDGFGNSSTNRFDVNEGVKSVLGDFDYYLSEGGDIFSIKKDEKQEKATVINENMERINHLLGYNPKSFIKTDKVKKNRGF